MLKISDSERAMFKRNRLFLIFLFAVISSIHSQPFPKFPPENVTATMGRDQMLWQLGIAFPQLPSQLENPHRSKNAFPSDPLNPEGNWTNSTGHITTRSPFGLWNNYSDYATGILPGPNSIRVGYYTPIDLLKAKDSTCITTPKQWWEKRRPEILNNVQEEVWEKIPPDSVLTKVKFSVESTANGGWIDIFRYPQVRNWLKILATLKIPANAQKPLPVVIIISGSFFAKRAVEIYWNHCAPHGWLFVYSTAILFSSIIVRNSRVISLNCVIKGIGENRKTRVLSLHGPGA